MEFLSTTLIYSSVKGSSIGRSDWRYCTAGITRNSPLSLIPSVISCLLQSLFGGGHSNHPSYLCPHLLQSSNTCPIVPWVVMSHRGWLYRTSLTSYIFQMIVFFIFAFWDGASWYRFANGFISYSQGSLCSLWRDYNVEIYRLRILSILSR